MVNEKGETMEYCKMMGVNMWEQIIEMGTEEVVIEEVEGEGWDDDYIVDE
jgi:hypothetical protein